MSNLTHEEKEEVVRHIPVGISMYYLGAFNKDRVAGLVRSVTVLAKICH